MTLTLKRLRSPMQHRKTLMWLLSHGAKLTLLTLCSILGESGLKWIEMIVWPKASNLSLWGFFGLVHCWRHVLVQCGIELKSNCLFQVICLSNLIFCEGSDKWTWPCHKLKWSQLMPRDQMHEKKHAHNVDQKWKWEVNIESGNWNYYWKVSVRKTKDCCETACKMPHERGQIWKM